MIALELYSIRDQLRDASRLADVLQKVREIGYPAVEVAGLDSDVEGRLGSELKRADLLACGAHMSLERLRADFGRVAETCAGWGCRYVVLPTLPTEYHTRDGYRRFAAEAIPLAGALRDLGLQLAYHNHARELERCGDRTCLEALLDGADPEVLKAELDTYWLQFGGASPSGWIRRLRGRVPLVHLKDMTVSEGYPVEADVGEGNLDWADILRACREAGTEWLIVERDESPDSMKSAAISFGNLAKLRA